MPRISRSHPNLLKKKFNYISQDPANKDLSKTELIENEEIVQQRQKFLQFLENKRKVLECQVKEIKEVEQGKAIQSGSLSNELKDQVDFMKDSFSGVENSLKANDIKASDLLQKKKFLDSELLSAVNSQEILSKAENIFWKLKMRKDGRKAPSQEKKIFKHQIPIALCVLIVLALCSFILYKTLGVAQYEVIIEISLKTDKSSQLILNRENLSKVIEKIEELPFDPKERQVALNQFLTDYPNHLVLKPTGDKNKVILSSQYNDPNKAARVAGEVINSYIREHNIQLKREELEVSIMEADMKLTKNKKSIELETNNLEKFKDAGELSQRIEKSRNNIAQLDKKKVMEIEFDLKQKLSNIEKLKTILNLKRSNNQLDIVSYQELSELEPFLELKKEMIKMEFDKFILSTTLRPNNALIFKQDQLIKGKKVQMVNFIKNTSLVPYSIDSEGDLAMLNKMLFLENEAVVITMVTNRQDDKVHQEAQLRFNNAQQKIDEYSAINQDLLAEKVKLKKLLSELKDENITIIKPPTMPSKLITLKEKIIYGLICLMVIVFGWTVTLFLRRKS